VFRVERKQWKDDGESQDIDGDDQKYRKEGRFAQEKKVRW